MRTHQKRLFQRSLLRWFSAHKRSFLWRGDCVGPEVILISEMLLRKTKAEAAEPVVKALLSAFPNLSTLAKASERRLVRLLRPIGLQNIRARALKTLANHLVQKHDGAVPSDATALLSLPHVGRYAANAVLCFAFKVRIGIVDTNVVRVFSRIFGTDIPVEIHKADHVWDLADSLLPTRAFRNFNWALLDLGALVCMPRRPDCTSCPLAFCCRSAGKW